MVDPMATKVEDVAWLGIIVVAGIGIVGLAIGIVVMLTV